MAAEASKIVDDSQRVVVARQLGVRFARPAGRRRPPARARRVVQRDGPLRADAARGVRRRLGARRGARAAQDRGDLRAAAHDHHPQRIARHFVRPLDQPLSRLRARLLLLLSRGRPTPISGFPPGSISRAGCSSRRARRRCWSASSRSRNTARASSRSAPTPTPISRSSGSIASPARCSKCWREARHPVGIVTKSNLVLRDLDHAARRWRPRGSSRSSSR